MGCATWIFWACFFICKSGKKYCLLKLLKEWKEKYVEIVPATVHVIEPQKMFDPLLC